MFILGLVSIIMLFTSLGLIAYGMREDNNTLVIIFIAVAFAMSIIAGQTYSYVFNHFTGVT